jgi:hypothetical protein
MGLLTLISSELTSICKRNIQLNMYREKENVYQKIYQHNEDKRKIRPCAIYMIKERRTNKNEECIC